MKRTAAVLALLLACASLSAADTILLNVGFGDFSGLGAPAQYHFFLFNKEGTSSFSTNTLGGDLGSNEGLQQCNQCDPRQFGILLFDAGIGHNGNCSLTSLAPRNRQRSATCDSTRARKWELRRYPGILSTT